MKQNIHKKIGQFVIIFILLAWFLSLIPGLILEYRHINWRLQQYAKKNLDEKERTVREEAAGYIFFSDYINGVKNDRSD